MFRIQQPVGEDLRVRVAQRAPAPGDHAVQEVAEDELAVGRPHRLEQRLGEEDRPALEAPAVPEEPLPATPGPGEGLGVRVGQRTPERGPEVEDEGGRLLVVRPAHQLRLGAAVDGRGLLVHRHRLLPGRVVAEAPSVGADRSGVQAAQVEGRAEGALEGHGEQIRHRLRTLGEPPVGGRPLSEREVEAVFPPTVR